MGSNGRIRTPHVQFDKMLQIATTEEMARFIEEITSHMQQIGYQEKDVFSTRLGLEEAIINALKHGNKFDETKKVVLRWRVDDAQMVVQVEDEGGGFDPTKLPDPLAPENLERPCGRGVFLINSYMTWAEYNDIGNCVTLCKERG